jgi:hypothetical protein
MTHGNTTKASTMSLRNAFDAEHARREAERHAREEAERLQQEEDLGRAKRLHDLLAGDPAFLAEKGLTLSMRRYTVTLDHDDFRIAAYFEENRANVTASDKRSATTSAAPRKQQMVDTVEDALLVMAQFLADETR